ncbi:MAG: hypothetical protein V4773_13780 [Verrucomicrobiota bacterium]
MKTFFRGLFHCCVILLTCIGAVTVAYVTFLRRIMPPENGYQRVREHSKQLFANDIAAIREFADLTVRLRENKALVAQLKPYVSPFAKTGDPVSRRLLLIPPRLMPAGYPRRFPTDDLDNYSHYQLIHGQFASLSCDAEGVPQYIQVRRGREGLFIGIAPNAIPHGDNLMRLVSRQPLMYVYAHDP